MDKVEKNLKCEEPSKGDFYVVAAFYKVRGGHNKLIRRMRFEVSRFLQISDAKIHRYHEFMESIFPTCKVLDTQSSDQTGHPDFKIIDGEDIFYIELKNASDNMQRSQIEWVVDNDVECYVLFLSKIKILESTDDGVDDPPDWFG